MDLKLIIRICKSAVLSSRHTTKDKDIPSPWIYQQPRDEQGGQGPMTPPLSMSDYWQDPLMLLWVQNGNAVSCQEDSILQPLSYPPVLECFLRNKESDINALFNVNIILHLVSGTWVTLVLFFHCLPWKRDDSNKTMGIICWLV